MNIIGYNIKRIREQRGIDYLKFILETRIGDIWMIEEGLSRPDLDKLQIIADFFNCTVGEFMRPLPLPLEKEEQAKEFSGIFNLLCYRDQEIIKHIMTMMLNNEPESLKDTDA